ncbi:MAG: hypothetical protein ACK551_05355 [Vampirovibrionales bacterium]
MIANSQLGQVRYNPNYGSGYARTGAEPTGTVDPTLQADSALATTTTGVPGDSFNPSATTLAPTSAQTLAPAEPEKKKTNWLAWGAAAAGGAALITFGGKSAGWWLKEAVKEGADDLAKAADDIVGKFNGFSRTDLDGLSREQLNQIHGAADEAAAKKLLAELRAAAPSTPQAPKPTVPANATVAKGLEGIDLENSSAVDINRALADKALTVQREAEDAQRALEMTFEDNQAQIKTQVGNRFNVSTHSTIGYGTRLPRTSQIETESQTVIDELARTAQKGDAIDKAKASYQLNNGSYKLVGFNGSHQPVYKFEAKPLYSEAEEQVLGLHYAGRTDVAEAVAKANNLEYTAGGTTLKVKGGTKSIELTDNSIEGYAELVNGGRAVALNEHGQVMTKEQVAEYIAECAKETPKKTPDLAMSGLYFKDGNTEIKPRIIVNTGADQAPKPRFSISG